uniref:Uncharacterized protein n=1 Tax=Helianthus annuus TaxID=4232 RepID=A0A251V6Q2_HELAN
MMIFGYYYHSSKLKTLTPLRNPSIDFCVKKPFQFQNLDQISHVLNRFNGDETGGKKRKQKELNQTRQQKKKKKQNTDEAGTKKGKKEKVAADCGFCVN